MRRYAPLVMLSLLLVAACDKGSANETDRGTTSGQGTNLGMNPPGTNANAPAVDNTRINERDRAGSATPIDQGNDMADLETTRQIRKALMADDSLSSDAKNLKVITSAGVVTLRGPVKSDAERRKVEAKAQELAGKNRVDNQIDVESNK